MAENRDDRHDSPEDAPSHAPEATPAGELRKAEPAEETDERPSDVAPTAVNPAARAAGTAPDRDGTEGGDGDDAPRADGGDTQRRPAADAAGDGDGPGGSGDAVPAEGDTSLSARARSRLGTTMRWLGSHRRAVAVVAALCVAVVVAIVAAATLATVDAPSDETVVADALENAAKPKRSAGDFDADDPLVAQSATVTGKSARDGGVEVTADVTFSNGSVTATEEATLSYDRTGDGWDLVSIAATGEPSYHATRGVDEDAVVENAGQLLARVDRGSETGSDDSGSSGSGTMLEVYSGGDFEVTSESFSEKDQTDEVTVHCTKAGTYTSYDCDVTATFRFVPASGVWELASAEASEDALVEGLQPIVGTWKGTFQSQESTGAKCFGAKDEEFTLTITKTKGTSSIEGTVTCLAHFHADLDEDAESTKGDEVLSEVSFKGKALSPSGDLSDSLYEFQLTLPEDEGGSVGIAIGFGTTDDPDQVVAMVNTSHAYTKSFLLIPYDATATYVDTFTLTKVS